MGSKHAQIGRRENVKKKISDCNTRSLSEGADETRQGINNYTIATLIVSL